MWKIKGTFGEAIPDEIALWPEDSQNIYVVKKEKEHMGWLYGWEVLGLHRNYPGVGLIAVFIRKETTKAGRVYMMVKIGS